MYNRQKKAITIYRCKNRNYLRIKKECLCHLNFFSKKSVFLFTTQKDCAVVLLSLYRQKIKNKKNQKTTDMKLAEALLLRADLNKKVVQLTARITPQMTVRTGKTTQEDPVKLLAQLRNAISELEAVIVKINKTNVFTYLSDGRTLMEALARRDALKTQAEKLRVIRQAATVSSHSYDIKASIKISSLQSEIDQTGRAFRELDTEIQGLNWTTDLKE